MEKSKEILAFQIEIQTPIEIIDPRVTRYSVGKKFSKLYWDQDFQSWVAVSRATGKLGLIGPNNIKGVLFIESQAPEAAPAKAPKALKVA